MNHKYMKILSMFLVVVFVLSACAPAATPTVVSGQTEPTKAPAAAEPTTAPAAANPMDYLNAAREDTIIFDQPYKLTAPDQWNPFVPNNSGGWGMQIASDGLMYLNYGDGKYIMWMAE